MGRRIARRLIPLLIGVACVFLVVRLFDWRTVWDMLANMRLGLFLATATPVLVVILALRGVRWLQVQGLALSPERIWLSFLANAVSSGFASFTPLQLGELVKLRLMRIDPRSEWPRAVPSFLVERLMDLSGLVGIGLAGLAAHFHQPFLAVAAVLTPLAAAAVLTETAKWIKRPLSQRWQPFLDAAQQPRRTYLAALITIPIWLLNAFLWWIAAQAIDVPVTFSHTLLLIGSVTLLAISSMTPGGLGVSELSSRGLLLLLGYSQIQAESVAIAVRLLTVLTIAVGAVCILVFFVQKALQK